MRIAVQIGTNDARDEIASILKNAYYDKIYLIEPHQKCNDSIRSVYAGENYEIVNIAITTKPELTETELYQFSDNGQHDSLLFRKTHVWREERAGIETLKVPCMTFMAFCEQRGITDVDFLCIDTEGLDMEIMGSIDFHKVNIRRLRWERWPHSGDDENGRYVSGKLIEEEIVDKLTLLGYDVALEDDANYRALKHPDKRLLPWIGIKDDEHIYEAIKYLPENPVIVEAGTCTAEDTIKMKELLPNATIHTFEPNRQLFNICVKNLTDKYGGVNAPIISSIHRWGQAKVVLYPMVLTDALSEVTFYESEFPHTSSLFANNFENIRAPQTVLNSLGAKEHSELKIWPEEPVTVQGINIDGWSVLHNIERVDYLWLDVEGAELKVLKGAKVMLPKVKVISLELNFQEFRKGTVLFNEIYDYLYTRGFTLKAIWQAHENWQANGIFARE